MKKRKRKERERENGSGRQVRGPPYTSGRKASCVQLSVGPTGAVKKYTRRTFVGCGARRSRDMRRLPAARFAPPAACYS